MDGLREKGVDCFFVDFLIDKACSHQDGHYSAKYREGGETHVFDDFDSVSHSKEGQQSGKNNEYDSEEEEEVKDSISDCFLESV